MPSSIDRIPFWWLAMAYVALWVLVGTLVRSVLRRWLQALAKTHESEWTEVVAHALPRPVGIAVFLVAIAVALRALPQEPGTLAAHKIAAVALALLGVASVLRVAFRAIDAFGRSNPELASTAGIGKALAWILGLAVAAVLVSDLLGISLAPALTALGVGSLAVALGLQDTLSNLFAGVYLIVDKPLRPGDYVKVDPSFEGYVQSIGWHSTRLRTLGENFVVIPNISLSKAVITNYSLPTLTTQSSVRVDVAPDADLDRAEAALNDVARSATDLDALATPPAPSVSMTPGFVDGGVAFTVWFSVKSFAQQFGAQHAIRKRIAARFRQEGIPLASTRTGVVKRDG